MISDTIRPGRCEMPARHPDLSGAVWRKSTRSSGGGQNCVEIAANLPGIVAVRDSKSPDSGVLSFRPDEWKVFLEKLRTAAYGL